MPDLIEAESQGLNEADTLLKVSAMVDLSTAEPACIHSQAGSVGLPYLRSTYK